MSYKKLIWILFVLLWFMVVIVALSFKKKEKYIYIKVEWTSMEPLLHNGNIYTGKKINSVDELKLWDIVVFKLYNAKTYYIKKLLLKKWSEYILKRTNKGEIYLIWKKVKLHLNLKKNYRLWYTLYIWCEKKYNKLCKVPLPQCMLKWLNYNSYDSTSFWLVSCKRIKYKLLNYNN